MIFCPNCGAENRAGLRLCGKCGALLQPGGASQGGAERRGRSRIAGRLRALTGFRGSKSASAKNKSPAHLAEPGVRDDLYGVDLPAPLRPPDAPLSGGYESDSLPEWLRGTEPEADHAEGLDWAADLDFSDLPPWQDPDEITREKAANPTLDESRGSFAPGQERDLTEPAEPEGTGLLHGVRGPIPVEPIIALPHPSPRPPGNTQALSSLDTGASARFAQVAAGALPLPTPVAPARRRAAQLSALNLVLLLAVILPLILGLDLTSPPRASSVALYDRAIDALPAESLAVIAVEYESALADDLEPGIVATLRHLRERNVRLLAVSTVPQGPALAQRLWRQIEPAGTGYGETFVNLGFLPGNELGVRALLADDGLGDRRDIVGSARLRDLPIGREVADLDSVDAIVVVSNDSLAVQRWIEQIGSARPDIVLLAVTTAAVEPALAPYLSSGQLHGLLGGMAGVAAYEQLRGLPGVAARRLDAIALSAAVFVLVVIVANLGMIAERLRNRRGA